MDFSFFTNYLSFILMKYNQDSLGSLTGCVHYDGGSSHHITMGVVSALTLSSDLRYSSWFTLGWGSVHRWARQQVGFLRASREHSSWQSLCIQRLTLAQWFVGTCSLRVGCTSRRNRWLSHFYTFYAFWWRDLWCRNSSRKCFFCVHDPSYHRRWRVRPRLQEEYQHRTLHSLR